MTNPKDQTKAILKILVDCSKPTNVSDGKGGYFYDFEYTKAIAKLTHIINKGKVSELERIVKWHSYGAVPKHIIDDRIKALKEENSSNGR